MRGSSTRRTTTSAACSSASATGSTALAEALLREETLDEADAYAAAGIDRAAAPA